MSARDQRIISLLEGTFGKDACQLEDESALHAGHAGAASGGGHYRVVIISTLFQGQNRINRHRLVYDCLRDMMHTEIHALAITALVPSEVSGD
jgi:BolA protein